MGVILIYGDSFSGRRALARSLAGHLGYRLITPDAVIEKIAAWGRPQQDLAALLEESPRSLDSFAGITRSQLLLLRAAIADEIRDKDAVCYGKIADLILWDDLPAIRIRTVVSRESRISIASRLFKLSKSDSAGFLRRIDRERSAWLRLIAGVVGASGVKPEIVIHSDRDDAQDPCETIARRVPRIEESYYKYDAIRLYDFAVSARVREALAFDPATGHLHVTVQSACGRVSIGGQVRRPQDIAEVHRVAESVAAGRIIVNAEVTGGQGAPPATIRNRLLPPFGVRLVYTGIGLMLAAALIFSGVAGRVGGMLHQAAVSSSPHPEIILGVVTDSQCGHRHPQSESVGCIRACVVRGGKYVLDDGTHLYELSDQRRAEQYAAREVRVKGFLAKSSRYLKVAAMEPL